MQLIRTALIVICLLSAIAVQASTPYQMNRLGFLPGDGHSAALSINSAGDVVGYSVSYNEFSNGITGAFLWDRTSGMVDIRVEDQFDVPGDINSNGQIAGTAYGPSTAVLRKANGELVQLSPLAEGAYGTFAYALNDNGWVVGTSGDYAVAWQGTTTAQWIGGASDSRSHATDINSDGSIVWYESLYSQYQWIGGRSYVWSDGVSTLLRGLNITDNCYVNAINDSGITVGSSGNHAVAWGADGSLIADLGIGTAYGINNLGQIVGTAGDSAWLWSIDGTISVDLGSLAGTGVPSEAYDVNDSGQVVGAAGYNEYQDMEAVLWETVPEPSSLIAIAGGLAGMGASLLRRRR